jgi:O-phosphoseryl-tRNA(Cys) synthetase
MMNYVTVQFGDKEKQLRFDFNAMADLEQHFGKGIAGIFNEEQIGFNTIRCFYWAGMKWKDRGLTVERTGKMLMKKVDEDGSDIEELMKPILEALQASGLMGDMNAEEDEEEAKN